MKTFKKFFVICSVAFAAVAVFGQGSFQNLNFESAYGLPGLLPSGGGSTVSVTNGVPGWNVFIGTNQQSSMLYNSLGAGSSTFSVYDTNFTAPVNSLTPLEGNFSVMLDAGVTGNFIPTDVSISQTGLVPVNTQSIFFEAKPGNWNLLLSLNGQNISFVALLSTANYTLYGGDISAFSGQTTQLEFTAVANPSVDVNLWFLDNIQFSTQAVPEPATWCLLIFGGLCLLFFQRKKITNL